MEETKMKVELQCVCNRIMKLIEQDEVSINTRLSYTCECGNRGLILIYPDV